MAIFPHGLFMTPPFWKSPATSSEKSLPELKNESCRRLLSHRRVVTDSGFTLLEIIVAIFVFSILITAVFNSFRSISSGAETLQRGDAFYQSAHDALSQMVRDLESVYVTCPPKYKPPEFNSTPDPYRVSGELSSMAGEQFSKLQFTSFEHIAINGDKSKGISQIIYYSHRVATDQFVLRRSDHVWPYEPFKESGNDPILCEKLKSIQFKYYDAAGEIHDHWNSDSNDFDNTTPRAVEIKLKIGDESGSVSLGTIVALPVFRDKITD
jgi:general secretion pathway protein J